MMNNYNIIYNEDCFITLEEHMVDGTLDMVLTSPPYNTSRVGKTQRSFDNYENRYDIHLDNKTDGEYLDWTVELFKKFNDKLKPNGCVLYNISYSSENTHLMWLVVADIIRRTPFTTADCIIWKKQNALPNNVSPNKLTRIVEYVFVFCRKSELKTFTCNKKVSSVAEKTGQNFYENIFNFVEAKNNDGPSKLNKATYSTDLCTKLLDVYAKPNSLVYDPFMGTGTTAIACLQNGHRFIGSELSEAQCGEAKERIIKLTKE